MRDSDHETGQALEDGFGDRMEQVVAPFYLSMAGTNARRAPRRFLGRVRAAAADLGHDDVVALLQMHWRPRVMGAWFAAASEDDTLSDAVHDSLETCLGHLTSPPLIVAVLRHPSSRTSALLADYRAADLEQGWGESGLATAALKRHDPTAVRDQPTAEDVELLDALVRVADALRAR